MKTNNMKIAWAFANAWGAEEGTNGRIFLSTVFRAFALRPAAMACLRAPTPEEQAWGNKLGVMAELPPRQRHVPRMLHPPSKHEP